MIMIIAAAAIKIPTITFLTLINITFWLSSSSSDVSGDSADEDSVSGSATDSVSEIISDDGSPEVKLKTGLLLLLKIISQLPTGTPE